MNILTRSFPISAQKEEALLRRLPSYHKKRGPIEENLEKAKAGYRGEKILDYHLSFLPKKEYYIFSDLRLVLDDKPFQIDVFVLSSYFGLIIESKNMAGTLTFDNFNQFIRTHEGKTTGFINPIAQAKRQRRQLQSWLESHKFKPFPVHYLISISYPSTILKSTINDIQLPDKIMHAIHIPEKIENLKQRYPDPVLSPYILQKLNQLLLQEHTPPTFDILSHYGISVDELIKGVQCPTCLHLPMKRKKASWYCPICQSYSKTAHQQVIYDYLLLVAPTINNQQCRDFLLLPSKDVAYKLLSSMNLVSSGSTKGTYYFLQDYSSKTSVD